jgi:hypothetical protein
LIKEYVIMGFLEDYVNAIETYPREYLRLEFTELNPPGDVLNVKEQVNFRLQVSNLGPLHIDNLRILVTARNGTQVKNGGAAAQYDTTALSNTISRVNAHSGDTPVSTPGSPMKFKAGPEAHTSVRELLVATVEEWEPLWDHPLTAHSDPDPLAKATFSSAVSAE